MEYLIIFIQGVVLFVGGAALFDVVHYVLHVWEHSRFRFLRFLGSLHAIHHDFLDREMKIQRQHSRGNILHHVLPEYMTGTAGTIALAALLGWWIPGALVVAIRTVMVAVYVIQKGEDYTHQPMNRISGNRGLVFVGPQYHALHHVYVRQHYSSFINVFDLVCGTNCQIEGRKFLVTGASGAYGSAMVAALMARGADVDTARSGVDFEGADCSNLTDKLERADVVVLAHGAKGAAAWDANYSSFVSIVEKFRELGLKRLVPPEVWAVGSEIELHPDFGAREYAASKRAFARKARGYYADPNLIYRHIVPSAFASGMGSGLISARTAVAWSLFFIARGFCYVPVTYTSLAWLNYFKFRFSRPMPETAR